MGVMSSRNTCNIQNGNRAVDILTCTLKIFKSNTIQICLIYEKSLFLEKETFFSVLWVSQNKRLCQPANNFRQNEFQQIHSKQT